VSETIQSDISYWADESVRILRQLEGCAFAGIPTFFPSVDRHIRGLVRGATTFLGGAPGMGKTAFITNIILRNVGLYGTDLKTLDPARQRILLVSAEMGEILWIQRCISTIIGIPQGMLALGAQADRLRWNSDKREMVRAGDANIFKEIDGVVAWLKQTPIELMGSGMMNTFSIEQKLHELTVDRRLDIPLTVIDHAGALSDVGESEGAVSKPDFVCQRLDYLARTYNTHVLAIWPLTKAGWQTNKIPSFDSLRGSVMPSYQAANAIMLHSPRLSELLMAERTFIAERIPVQVSIQKNRFFGSFEVVEEVFVPCIGRYEFFEEEDWLEKYRGYTCPIRAAASAIKGVREARGSNREEAINIGEQAARLFRNEGGG